MLFNVFVLDDRILRREMWTLKKGRLGSPACSRSSSSLRKSCCRHRRKTRRRIARTPQRNRRSCTWDRRSLLQGGRTRSASPPRPPSGRRRSWKSAKKIHLRIQDKNLIVLMFHLTWNRIMSIVDFSLFSTSTTSHWVHLVIVWCFFRHFVSHFNTECMIDAFVIVLVGGHNYGQPNSPDGKLCGDESVVQSIRDLYERRLGNFTNSLCWIFIQQNILSNPTENWVWNQW